MFTDIERAVRAEFIRVMPELNEDELDLRSGMVEQYGLTSLNKVLFLTSVCDSLNVSLATFTESDLAEMRTLEDVVTRVAAHRQPTTSAVFS